MSILIHIEFPETREGVTANRVRLQSGTRLGRIEHAGPDAFVARTTQGHLLVRGDTVLTLPSLTDAAAHLWMAFMAHSADLDSTPVRSDHAG